MTGIAAITQETIQNQIYTIRGKQVMKKRFVHDISASFGKFRQLIVRFF